MTAREDGTEHHREIAREREITRAGGLNGQVSMPRWLPVAVVAAFVVLAALIVGSLVGLERAATARAELACRSDLTNRQTIARVAELFADEPYDPGEWSGEVQRFVAAHNARARRLVDRVSDRLDGIPSSCEGFEVELVPRD
jgi:hypothetical protein